MFILRLLEGSVEPSGLDKTESVVINDSEQRSLLYNRRCESHGRLVNAAFIFTIFIFLPPPTFFLQ
jgi:hypothetical protein